jgi:sulfoxide reductase heme-binding subunit YedZ
MRGPDPLHHVWWITSRAAGISALLAVTASVLIGLLMATKILRRPKLNRTLMSVHEHAALAGLIAIAVHGLTLLGDPWLRPGLSGLLVPFTMGYRPLYTGLGVVAAFLAALLGLSFYARRRIGARLWRRLHRWTIAVYVLGVVHTLGAGTDASTAWMRVLLLVTGAPIVFLSLVRFLPQRTAAPAGGAVASRAGAGGDPGGRSTRTAPASP